MPGHPVTQAFRFTLELVALVAFAFWGWTAHAGVSRVAWAVGLPLLAAALWGVFRVPGDPGDAPVAVPGAVRLLLELVVFGAAVWLLAAAGRPLFAGAFGVLVALHYLTDARRVRWLLAQR